MPASWEILSLKGISKQSWLTPEESDRMKAMLIRWKNENPKSTFYQMTLVEMTVRNHLMLQRLFNKKYFLDGSKVPSYSTCDNRKASEIDEEDSKRKAAEFEKWYPILFDRAMKCHQLGLAEKIEISGDIMDIASLVMAYQKGNEVRSKNGEDGNNRCFASRVS